MIRSLRFAEFRLCSKTVGICSFRFQYNLTTIPYTLTPIRTPLFHHHPTHTLFISPLVSKTCFFVAPQPLKANAQPTSIPTSKHNTAT